MADRRAGLIVPLFSCSSSASWGIGEIGDLQPMTAWMADAGLRALLLLPINEMARGQQSPYSAMSAMAIDPIYIRLPDVPDFNALGGEFWTSADARTDRVEYARVRRVKDACLRASFDHFLDAEWRRDSARARELQAFVRDEAWWVDDYSLFRAIHAREGDRPWTEWPDGLRDRRPDDLDRARRELANERLYYEYLQWLADRQWREARGQCHGVAILGDLPFMVDLDSADVWARQDQFHFDATIGAPPDAFSAEGQDWGTPLYRWDVIASDDFRWLRDRARRCAALFDGYRIDHLVGFYRTYGRPKDGRAPYFTPAEEPEQLALGERIVRIFLESGSAVSAEDLGTVPDFVRASLARLGVPGFKVLRWERRWHDEGQPFRHPSEYPPVSVAVSGTHDTSPLAVWWNDEANDEEKRKVGESLRLDLAREPFDRVRDVLIEALFASGSNLVLLPIQDVFGWRDRINDPSVVAGSNWVYRLPWPVDRLNDVPDARERQLQLRRWSTTHNR